MHYIREIFDVGGRHVKILTHVLWLTLLAAIAGAAGAAQKPPEVLSEDKELEIIQYRQTHTWKQGKLMWETEERIGIKSNGSTIPYRKDTLKDIRRHKVEKKKYYLEQADKQDNTYTADSYRKAIKLVKKALDVDPDFEKAKERLSQYKEELAELTRLEKQEARAEMARQHSRAISGLQQEFKSLRYTVNELHEQMENLSGRAVANLQQRTQQIDREVRRLRRYYTALEDELRYIRRYRYGGRSYFYYYGREDKDNRDHHDDGGHNDNWDNDRGGNDTNGR